MMPDINGVELARMIQREGFDDLPLVLVTADAGDLPAESVLFARCLRRPIREAALRRTLLAALSGAAPTGCRRIPPRKPSSAPKLQEKLSTRVLLAEDNLVNQKLATVLLGRWNVGVDVACTGQEALDLLEGGVRYELILMDCQMPVMDGYEATRQIRLREKSGELEPIKIVAMTANALRASARITPAFRRPSPALASLLVGYIYPICALLAPCQDGRCLAEMGNLFLRGPLATTDSFASMRAWTTTWPSRFVQLSCALCSTAT